ncbi:MAG: cell division protein FtsX [Pseudorhodoplanes sp.]
MSEFETEEAPAPARPARAAMPGPAAPIVPQDSIGGRALVTIIAIMTFLASITTGAVTLVRASASEWQSDVAREVTIQVRPATGRDIEADVARAAEVARGLSGVAEVRPYSKEESARLLEPWLGGGLALDALPVPRVIVVRLAGEAPADLGRLRVLLAEQVPPASLDDHRGWIERMRGMADTVVVIGILVLALMLASMMLSVVFATRGAMATNRPVVEVLHFIGARDAFIAAEFQRHFLMLGLKGGAIGGGVAILLFALGGFLSARFVATAGGDQLTSLFGAFAIGPEGYALILLQVGLVAAVTAVTSRQTVNRTLEAV